MGEQNFSGNFAAVKWWEVVCLLTILPIFVMLLNAYDLAFMPPIGDESLFLQPAQSFAEGKGMRTPALDDLLPGISERTYWQPPVYFLAIAAWGKLAGFDIVSSRWFSRLCGVAVLTLAWVLARLWGMSWWLALFCVVWTSLDLAFQYIANLGRMDALNALLLLASLIAFTMHQRSGKNWQAGLSGVFAALATLTHFIAIPTVLALGFTLMRKRRKETLICFAVPIAIGWVLWLAYAAQDWQSWFWQLKLQFARKGEGGLSRALVCLWFPQSLLPIFGVFPVNSPPIWFALSVLSCWALIRRHLQANRWQVMLLVVTYFSAAYGGEVWYIGWWTPFGYLLLCLWLKMLFERLDKKSWLLVVCALWVCWQSFKVGQTVAYVPILKRDIDKFFAEVSKVLPSGSKVLLHSVPDPFPVLQSERPDLQLIQISPTPMPPKSLARVQSDADFFVGLTDWGKGRGLKLPEPLKEWRFQAPKGIWVVRVHKFPKARHFTRTTDKTANLKRCIMSNAAAKIDKPERLRRLSDEASR